MYERFLPIVVTSGRITLGLESTTACVEVNELNLLGVTYTVLRSAWQRRASESEDWSSIAGTETELELCAYVPTESGQYRLIGDVEVNGVLNHYASNVLTVD